MRDSFDRRRFLQSAAGASIVVQLPSSWLYAAANREAELWKLVDPMLRPVPVAVPDSQNAYPLLLQACKQLGTLPEAANHGEFDLSDCFSTTIPNAQRDAMVGAWLDENERVLDLVKQAASRGKLEFPTVPYEDARSQSWMALRELSRFLQASSQRLLSQGKCDVAAEVAKLMSDTFSRMRTGGGMYVEYLIAGLCEGDAWKTMARVARHRQSSVNTIRTMLAHLPGRTEPLDGIRQSMCAEYAYCLFPALLELKSNDIEKLVRGCLDWKDVYQSIVAREQYEKICKKICQLLEGHPKPFDLVDTVERSSSRYATIVCDCDLPWARHKDQPDPVPSAELAAWPAQLSLSLLECGDPDEVTDAQIADGRERLRQVENPIGKKYVECGLIDSKAMHRGALTRQAQHEGMRVFLAVCIFAREQGNLPASLNELVEGKILKHIPVDPFSSRPFQYSRERRALWSIGASGKVAPGAKDEDPSDYENLLWPLEEVVP